MPEIHIGELIEEKFKEKHKNKTLTKASFARLINIDRSTVYSLFESRTIDIGRLMQISRVLEYDFIKEVYLKDQNLNTNTAIIGVVVPIEKLRELDLPEEFIKLVM